MTARTLDGAVVSQGGREWILHEDEDDECRRYGWSECGACGETVTGGDDARSDHECRPPCPECGEPRAEVISSYGGTRVRSCCGEEVRCPCGAVTSTNHRSVCTAWIEP